MENIKFEQPLRSLNDFLLTSRYQVFNIFADPARWENRVKANLVYYRTNYFIMFTTIFLINVMIQPVQMMAVVPFVIAVSACCYLIRSIIWRIDRIFPFLSFIIVLWGSTTLAGYTGSVEVLWNGILYPMIAIWIHATLRLQNKVNILINIKKKLKSCKNEIRNLGTNEQQLLRERLMAEIAYEIAKLR